MKNKILDASVTTVRDHGLTKWTVERVSEAARCAKGLVLYHYGSKAALLGQTAEQLGQSHRAARLEAIKGLSGTEALDSLWLTLSEEVRTGWFKAWLEVSVDGRPPIAPQDRSLGSALSRALAIPEARMPEAEAVAALLDGVQLRLLLGDSEDRVRAGYERLWLGLLSA